MVLPYCILLGAAQLTACVCWSQAEILLNDSVPWHWARTGTKLGCLFHGLFLCDLTGSFCPLPPPSCSDPLDVQILETHTVCMVISLVSLSSHPLYWVYVEMKVEIHKRLVLSPFVCCPVSECLCVHHHPTSGMPRSLFQPKFWMKCSQVL